MAYFPGEKPGPNNIWVVFKTRSWLIGLWILHINIFRMITIHDGGIQLSNQPVERDCSSVAALICSRAWPPRTGASCDVHAYDANTGGLRWVFHGPKQTGLWCFCAFAFRTRGPSRSHKHIRVEKNEKNCPPVKAVMLV